MIQLIADSDNVLCIGKHHLFSNHMGIVFWVHFVGFLSFLLRTFSIFLEARVVLCPSIRLLLYKISITDAVD